MAPSAGGAACPFLACTDECLWTIMHRCAAVDLLRLALTCTQLLEAARAAADAKLLRRWPLWRRRIATGESPLVQLVVSELSCVLAVGGTWKAEEYWGAETSGTSATDSVEVAFVRSRAPAAASHADGLAPSVRRASHASELCVDWVGGLAPLPHAWRRGCALALHNLVVVVGGYIHNEQTAQCAAYAPERDEWLVGPALAHRRNVASAVQHLGAAWVAGGFDGRDHLASTEILRPPAADEAAGAGGRGGQGEGALAAAGVLRGWCWQSGPPLLCARSSASVASVGSCLVAVGGYGPQPPANTPGALRSVEVLRAGSPAWEPLEPLAEGRSDLALALHAGWLYAIGGSTANGKPTSLVEKLSASRLLGRATRRGVAGVEASELLSAAGAQWARAPQLLVPRSGCGACVVHGRLVVVGGKGPNNTRLANVEVLCVRSRTWILAQAGPPLCRLLASTPQPQQQPPSSPAAHRWPPSRGGEQPPQPQPQQAQAQARATQPGAAPSAQRAQQGGAPAAASEAHAWHRSTLAALALAHSHGSPRSLARAHGGGAPVHGHQQQQKQQQQQQGERLVDGGVRARTAQAARLGNDSAQLAAAAPARAQAAARGDGGGRAAVASIPLASHVAAVAVSAGPWLSRTARLLSSLHTRTQQLARGHGAEGEPPAARGADTPPLAAQPSPPAPRARSPVGSPVGRSPVGSFSSADGPAAGEHLDDESEHGDGDDDAADDAQQGERRRRAADAQVGAHGRDKPLLRSAAACVRQAASVLASQLGRASGVRALGQDTPNLDDDRRAHDQSRSTIGARGSDARAGAGPHARRRATAAGAGSRAAERSPRPLLPPPPVVAMQRSEAADALSGALNAAALAGARVVQQQCQQEGAAPAPARAATVSTCETRHSLLFTPRDAFGLVALHPARVGWLEGGGAQSDDDDDDDSAYASDCS